MELGKQIGVGRTATVYEYGKGKVIKLYNEEISETWIDNEVSICRIACEHSEFAPKVFEKIVINKQTGIVFEQIKGKTLLEMLQTGKSAKYIGKIFASCQMHIHGIKTDKLKDQYTYFKERILSTDLLKESEKEKIINYLEKLPKENILCHGDLHPDNILCNENRSVVIDWTNAYYGHPSSDLTRSILMMNTPYIKELIPIVLYPLIVMVNKIIVKELIKNNMKVGSLSTEMIKQWELPVAAARLCENVPREKDWLLKKISKLLENI